MADELVEPSPVLPPDRLSYLEINQFPIPDFDENVIKSLSNEFKAIAQEEAVPTGDAPPEPIKTYLRIRPYEKKSEDEPDFIEIKDDETIVANTTLPGIKGLRKICKKTEYKFTRVLDSTCSQQQVYELVVAPLMERFEKGENCLVFSYGATNSGKTFTMQGSSNKFGIIPRTLDYVFNRYQDKIYTNCDFQPVMHESSRSLSPEEQQEILDKKAQLLAYAAKTNEMKCRPSTSAFSTSGISSHCGSLSYVPGEPWADLSSRSYGTFVYSMWVSFVELYNEKCYDLLDSIPSKFKGKRKVLKVISDKSGHSFIKDLTEVPVYNEEEAFGIYVAGTKRLQMGATQINQSSSRSHCFFSIRVVELGINKINIFPVHTHRLTFCDLAGMERASQTENTGQQLRESANINNSLLSLLKVIRMIREKQTCAADSGQSFLEKIPFRDSQLTRMFRGYFTSSTHIVMIVNVNPSPNMVESSTITLKSSAIAKNIIAFRQPHMEDILEEEEESDRPEHNEKSNITNPSQNLLKPTRSKPSFPSRRSPGRKKGRVFLKNYKQSVNSNVVFHPKMAEIHSTDEFTDESDKENEEASGSIGSISESIQYSFHSYIDRIKQLEYENSNLINEKDAYVKHCDALKEQYHLCKQKYRELLDKHKKTLKLNQTLQKQLAEKDADMENTVAIAVQDAKEELSRLFMERMESQEQLNRENNERTHKLLLANRESKFDSPSMKG